MKNSIFTLIITLIAFTANAQTKITCADVCKIYQANILPSAPGYAKIKTINKFFHIRYAFTDANGNRQLGDIGYSCLSGTPDMGYIKAYTANHFGIKLDAITFKGGPAAIGESDFQNIMRHQGITDIIFFIQ
jgi:hypothetical protein